VRKAIEEAIDRCQIIETVFGQPCANLQVDTILPAPSPDYDPTIKTYSYDLGQARKDMQIAGWNCSSGICTRNGQVFPTLRLVTTNNSTMRQQVTEDIKQYLAALGIPISLSYPPHMFTNYTRGGILATGQYDLSLFAYTWGLDDDGNLSTFDSSQIPSADNPDGGNYERVNDPLIDDDLAQGRIKLDMAARMHIYQALQQVLVQKVYVVPMFLNVNITFVSPNIGNQQPNPITSPGQGNLWNIGDWFLYQ
jgi:peptide/nickel transport system substrate-binding protein